jgi:protease IV
METKTNTTATQTKFEKVFKTVGKWWVVGTSLIGSLLVLGIVALIVSFFNNPSTGEQTTLQQTVVTQGGLDQVAVVDISGVIVDEVTSGDPFALDQGVAPVRDLKKVLTHLAKEDQVKAVVLRINSPGGAVVASDELYLAIKELANKKPVVAQLNDLAASGGYYAALGANHIVANKASITGSIGVIAQFPEFTELFNKIGVEVHTIKSGQYKDIGAVDRPLTAEEQAILQSIIDDAYDQFVTAVATGRNLPEDQVRVLADGRIYSGQQALDAKLVDELGTFDDALKRASQLAKIENPTIVEYHDESLFALLFSAVRGVSPTAELAQVVPSSKFGVYYLLSL